MGMVLGLSLTRLLGGTAKALQNPERYGLSLLHLGWAFSIFLEIILFWWWEFMLITIQHWTFEIYFFVIIYTCLIYFTCIFIYPEELPASVTYADYFLQKKRLFYGVTSLMMFLSFMDVVIKGDAYMEHSLNYVLISSAVLVALFISAVFVKAVRYQFFVMGVFVVVQLWGIFWLLRTIA